MLLEELASLYREEAFLQSEVERAHIEAYERSGADSHAARERDAKAQTLGPSTTLHEVRGRILVLEAMREFGMVLMTRAR